MTLQASLHAFADKLLDAAMAAERRQARLETGTVALPSGPVAYFHRPGSAAAGGDARWARWPAATGPAVT